MGTSNSAKKIFYLNINFFREFLFNKKKIMNVLDLHIREFFHIREKGFSHIFLLM